MEGFRNAFLPIFVFFQGCNIIEAVQISCPSHKHRHTGYFQIYQNNKNFKERKAQKEWADENNIYTTKIGNRIVVNVMLTFLLSREKRGENLIIFIPRQNFSNSESYSSISFILTRFWENETWNKWTFFLLGQKSRSGSYSFSESKGNFDITPTHAGLLLKSN